MAKKAELLEQAKKLKLDVSAKNTIAEIEATLQAAGGADTIEKETESESKVAVAKAGKRSARAQEQAEAKEAKEERKTQAATVKADEKPKQTAKPTRPKLDRRGKKFRDASAEIEKNKSYSLAEALGLATKTSPVKFDATVELHVNLAVDPRQADQNVRDNLVLPAGTGKSVRVAVFADSDTDNADVAGVEAITKALEKGTIDFDILIASPANMPKLGKYARLLGPRGLMPNPKSGTVTNDIQKAIAEAKAGRVEYRVDSTGIVHLGIGKVSFGPDKLLQNAQAVLASVKAAKPASVKSGYIKSAHVTTSMGPSIRLAITDI